LAVCSAIDGEGKTTVSLGLGVTIAQDYPERRVVIIETDLEHPVLAKDFDLEATPGLADCVMADQPIAGACRATFLPNLQLVPAGGPVTNPSRLLRSSRMAAQFARMRDSYDLVILDVPAVLGNSDALLLSDFADGVLLVVRAGVTPTSLVNGTIAQLDEGKLRGVVLNGAHSAVPSWLRRLCGL
jgi:capsular exopolysaccharide synthesis family protein